MKTPFYAGTSPKCFQDQKQFDEWRKTYGRKTISPCDDCTEAYQAKMIQDGRCENPSFAFGNIDPTDRGPFVRRTPLDGDGIARAQKFMGLSNLELCGLLNVTEATLCNWKSGRHAVPGPVDLAVRLLLKSKP